MEASTGVCSAPGAANEHPGGVLRGLPRRAGAARVLSGRTALEVQSLLDRWLDPAHRYFKVGASDGNIYVLRYDEARAEWELGAFLSGTRISTGC